MRKNLRKYSLLPLMLGWILVQAAVVDHEFSADHFFSGKNHVCIAQVAHLDDIITSHDAVKTVLLVEEARLELLSEFKQPVQRAFNLYLSRAPPSIFNFG
ncbi:hypothetical protein [Aliikangiella sp. G2MR2-5]|uniref:hypothetical protein n=1 Tax=Aliikangiella sp. G2MR2-5 TaxID=2788943 RepID=UPI0018AAF23A|nr:hypothetical protein [Aliikangiella sp. G2MR2-5]